MLAPSITPPMASAVLPTPLLHHARVSPAATDFRWAGAPPGRRIWHALGSR